MEEVSVVAEEMAMEVEAVLTLGALDAVDP